ncbi:hypothetical protein O9929_16470 [Vibrio lentus]|nr:hypothetical protein [Vibrio lentus]
MGLLAGREVVWHFRLWQSLWAQSIYRVFYRQAMSLNALLLGSQKRNILASRTKLKRRLILPDGRRRWRHG